MYYCIFKYFININLNYSTIHENFQEHVIIIFCVSMSRYT